MTRRTVRVDFRYVYVEYELSGIERVLTVLERELEHLADQTKEDVLRDVQLDALDDADHQFVSDEIREVGEYILPRLVRGSMIVAIWASYEAIVKQVAWTRLSEMASKRRFKPRGAFVAGARHFFEDELDLPLERDEARRMRLVDLETIRNAFAHANGLEDGMTPEKWRELKRVAARQQTPVLEWHDMLVPSAAFVRGSFDDVASSARDLVARARRAPKQRSGVLGGTQTP